MDGKMRQAMRFILLELERTAKIPKQEEVKSTSKPRGFVKMIFTTSKMAIIMNVIFL